MTARRPTKTLCATTILPALRHRPSPRNPLPLPLHHCSQQQQHHHHHQKRTFTNALTPLQTLHASRILPYHASSLFALIADIESYPSFIPYCTSSRITSLSGPDALHARKWPRMADLRVGWGGYSEVFRSRVFCRPDTVLEAVAGEAEGSMGREEVPHYFADSSSSEEGERDRDGEGQGKENEMFTSLLTRWTLREFPFKSPPMDGGKRVHDAGREEESAPRTEVGLLIEARFASAVYSALSQAAAPKVAGLVIEAFEKRARQVLGEGHAPGREGVERQGGKSSALEGVSQGVR